MRSNIAPVEHLPKPEELLEQIEKFMKERGDSAFITIDTLASITAARMRIPKAVMIAYIRDLSQEERDKYGICERRPSRSKDWAPKRKRSRASGAPRSVNVDLLTEQIDEKYKTLVAELKLKGVCTLENVMSGLGLAKWQVISYLHQHPTMAVEFPDFAKLVRAVQSDSSEE